jgi:hypothetical protein
MPIGSRGGLSATMLQPQSHKTKTPNWLPRSPLGVKFYKPLALAGFPLQSLSQEDELFRVEKLVFEW